MSSPPHFTRLASQDAYPDFSGNDFPYDDVAEFLNNTTEPGSDGTFQDEFLNAKPGDDSTFQDPPPFYASGFQCTSDDFLNFDPNALPGSYDDNGPTFYQNALVDWNDSSTFVEDQQEPEATSGQEDTAPFSGDETESVDDSSSEAGVESTSNAISQQDVSSRAQVRPPVPNPELEALREHVPALINSGILTQDQKSAILAAMPEAVLNDLFQNAVTIPNVAFISSPSGMTENSYRPTIQHDQTTFGPPARMPVYPMYSGRFRTMEQARRYRKRSRVGAKDQAPDLYRVRKYGRQYWVRELYHAMISVSDISDGHASIHRLRFTTYNKDKRFEALDLEAVAHHVFDMALSVHERGWTRPKIYHKKAVRGKLVDLSEQSVEERLSRICACLREKKAVVDDAVRGGITLALLCDNPEARSFTKFSNDNGNKKRGERLKLIKKIQAKKDRKDKVKGKKKEQNEQELEELERELAEMGSESEIESGDESQ